MSLKEFPESFDRFWIYHILLLATASVFGEIKILDIWGSDLLAFTLQFSEDKEQ
jgi:hypothetical protein